MSALREKIAVVSDLHLLAKSDSIDIDNLKKIDNKITRLQIEKILEKAAELQKDMEQNQVNIAHFVLNGDIFEYMYPRVGAAEVTRQAVKFIKDLTERFPKIQFHYIHGNHDCAKELHHELKKLAENLDGNLTVNLTHRKIGNALFTHGDILLGEQPKNHNHGIAGRTLEDHSRLLIPQDELLDEKIYENLIKAAAGIESFFYKTVNTISGFFSSYLLRRDVERKIVESAADKEPSNNKSRKKAGELYHKLQQSVQRWIEEFRDPLSDARKIVGALVESLPKNQPENQPNILTGVGHIFTGHTHIPYADIEIKFGTDKAGKTILLPKGIDALKMHNTGAPLVGARMNLMTVMLEDKKISEIEVGQDYKGRIPTGGFTKKNLDDYVAEEKSKIKKDWTTRMEDKGVSFPER